MLDDHKNTLKTVQKLRNIETISLDPEDYKNEFNVYYPEDEKKAGKKFEKFKQLYLKL